ncbi:hypothetical protein ACQKIE_14140 [Luteibacter sp. NPDC031894]|uniref:hypothetical protein n=1 Tax=Luteibacter sp. NPDC031894 TaxID=3390572 RepID=UPI003D08035D
MTTVFGVAIAAIASCQRFHPHAPDPRGLAQELADADACLDGGGSWSLDARRCVRRADTLEGAAPSWRD